MDFTIDKFTLLLQQLIQQGYVFQTFNEFLKTPQQRSIILRHDIDFLPYKALQFARLQYSLGIRGTYYFRIVPMSLDHKIINEIASFGHEIGYHYETIDICVHELRAQNKKFHYNDLLDCAYEEFCTSLIQLRKLYSIETICMHGSPKSKYDNREIWNKYDYKTLGIIGEPYFDINFNQVYYLTDTGRRWDGGNVSVRDIVKSNIKLKLHSTDDIINSINLGYFPDQSMITFHPQRWHDEKLLWIKELIFQNLKNVVKRVYVFNQHRHRPPV